MTTFRALSRLAGVALVAAATSMSGSVGAAPSGYQLPFNGTFPISVGPGCYYTHGGARYEASAEAIDFAMVRGTPIRPAAAGQVVSVSWDSSGFGNLVKIRHSDGNVSYYAHLDGFASGLASGTPVTTSTTIGYSGNTTSPGSSVGYHLHFEVRSPSGSPVSVRDLPGMFWYNGHPLWDGKPCMAPGQNDGIATSTPALASPLGAPDLRAWCIHLGNRDIATAINNAYGLRCVTPSGAMVAMSVLAACQYQYGNAAVDIMRDFNNPYDWQCYQTGQMLGQPDLNNYCRARGFDGMVAIEPTAYGLRCGRGTERVAMSVLGACRWQYERPNIIDSMRDFNNPQDWNCWTIN